MASRCGDAIFFCTPAWGVTTAWLRQYTQRLVRHFASFTGEAAVHRAAAARAGNLDDVPDEARKKLRGAWLTWRIVVRTHQRYAAEGDIIPEKEVDLSLDPSDLAVSVSPWYEDFMLHRRINRRPRDHNIVIFDGNAKLRRWRVCGRPLATLMRSRRLGKFTAISCPETRAKGCRHCAKHHCKMTSQRRVRGKRPAPVRLLAHRKAQALLDAADAEPYEVAIASGDAHDGAAPARHGVRADTVSRLALTEYWSKCQGYMASASDQAALAASKCQTHKEAVKGPPSGQLSGGWLVACDPDGYILLSIPPVK